MHACIIFFCSKVSVDGKTCHSSYKQDQSGSRKTRMMNGLSGDTHSEYERGKYLEQSVRSVLLLQSSKKVSSISIRL